MRALKTVVVVMGIMLIGGFATLVAVIAGKLSHSDAPRSFAAAIDIPRGARIEAMTTGPDRLLLAIMLPEGGRQVLVINLTTGARLGIVELRPTP